MTGNPESRSGRRRGVALLLVLWLMAILTLLMYSFLGDMQVEYSIAGGYGDSRKAEQLAWSAIDLACATVINDTQAWQSLNDTTWANNPTTFFDVELGDGAYSVFRPTYDDQQTVLWGLDDEASKINLNTATREILLKLPNMTEELVDAILDWRDADATPGASGAETSYYNTLNPPYNCKNAPFETLEELLYVKGMTPALLFGEDFNLNGVLEPNENDGDDTWPPDNRDGKLDPGLWSLCTVWSSDKNVDAAGARRVNINSAQPAQLAAAGLTPAEVQQIGTQRLVLPFLSVAQLLGNPAAGVPAIVAKERFSQVVDKLTVSDDQNVPGLVNINTCPKQVLLALPGITDEIAVKIMEYRTTPGNDLSNMGWLLNVVEPAVLQRFAPFITCRSYQFRIHAVGRVGTPYDAGAGSSTDNPERPRAFRRMVAVFDKLATPNPRLVYWKDQTKLGMPYDPQDGPTPTR
ncbi:MAG: general secretion pathway protein GspK [Planctomycetaceae bacterium]|nr:general secretion pathway protein GspK [Planctomycetaceae bacterium]